MSDSVEYEFEAERVEPLPEPNFLLFDTFRVKKYNRSTYVLNGNVTLRERIDDTVDALFVNYNMQGREYRKIFERKARKVCSTLFTTPFKKGYENIAAHSDLPKFGDCDFPPVSMSKLYFMQLPNFFF